MGSLQFPNMGMGLRLAAFGRRSSAITWKQYITSFMNRCILIVDNVTPAQIMRISQRANVT